jgi:hypothetical protein
LAGHQRQQRNRLGLLGLQLQAGHRLKQGQRIVDQPRHQRLGGLGIVPGTFGLAWPVIVVRGELDLARRHHHPPHPADRRHQLGDGVLGGDRVGQDCGVQHPPTPTLEHPGLLRHLADRLQDLPRPIRGPQPRSPGHQHRGVKPSSSSRSPQATFQAMSRRNALIASRSDRPSRACSTITVAITSAGTEGCPPA